MKKILFALVLLLSSVAVAQVPRTISYQGLLTDGSGNFIPDGNHSLTIKLYESASGGSAVYEESQSTAIVKGLFNVIIGSVTPIPPSLAFDKAYYMGVAVDGGGELVPRSAISAAPYALYASVAGTANSLAPGVTGVVTSVNEKSGAVTLQGGGATTVTSLGNVITISSTGGGGGTGIQGVQSTDGSLGITNSTGPIADLSIPNESITSAKILNGTIAAGDIAGGVIPTSLPPSGAAGGDLSGTYPNPTVGNNAITTAKVAANAVTNAKIGSGAATNGQVLTADGAGNTSWTTVAGGGGLTLPYTGSISNAGTVFSITNSGAGEAIKGLQTSTTSTTAAVRGESASTTGGAFGVYGLISATAPGGYSAAVRGLNNGTGGNGIGVWGSQSGSGWGIFGTAATGGVGIYGYSDGGQAGKFEVAGASNSNPALYATSTGTGPAADFYKNGSSANSTVSIRGGTTFNTAPLFVRTDGTGEAAIIRNYNTSNSATALEVSTAGSGKASLFTISNSGSSANTIEATTNGTGVAVRGIQSGTSGNSGFFEVTNSSNINPAVNGTTSGGGPGVFGYNTGTTGKGGTFKIANASSTTEALLGTTNGTSATSYGVVGEHTATSGTGAGVYGKTASTTSLSNGVLGEVTPTSPGGSSTGVRGINNGTSSSGIGVWGSQDGDGWGVYGSVTDAGIAVRGVASGAGTGGYFECEDGGNALIADLDGSTASSTTANNIAIFRDAGIRRARIDRTGKGFFNGGTQASGADVAEAFAVVGDIANYEPGDVLVIASGYKRTVEKSSKPYATSVLGVHATKPGMLLTERDIDSDMTDLVPMGVVGVLPTKVTSQGGAIKAGDLLVTSSKMGYAMKGDPRKMKLGMVIGKALEDFDGKEGIINVFVNVK